MSGWMLYSSITPGGFFHKALTKSSNNQRARNSPSAARHCEIRQHEGSGPPTGVDPDMPPALTATRELQEEEEEEEEER
jgi:hypothetical protein